MSLNTLETKANERDRSWTQKGSRRTRVAQKPLREKTTYDQWNLKWLYCRKLISDLLCCFTLPPAEPDFPPCKDRKISDESNRTSKLKTVPHQSYGKGPKSEIRCLSLHPCSLFLLYSLIQKLKFSSVDGVFFSFVYAKQLYLYAQSSWMPICLVCSYKNNTGQTSAFWRKKINRCPEKSCRQKASVTIDTQLWRYSENQE